MGHDLNTYRAKLGGAGRKRIPPAKIIAWLEHHFDCKSRKDGEEYMICDPFDGDTNYRFSINVYKEIAHSWHGDSWAGPINPKTGKRNCSFTKFVQRYKKCSYAEAVRDILGSVEDIKSYLRPENRPNTAEPLRKVAVALPAGTERLADNQNDKQAHIIIDWLKSRGYSLEDIDRDDICHLGMDCYWPYYEFEELCYWQSRNRLNKVYRFPDLKVYSKSGEVVGETDGSKGDFLYGFDDCDNASFIIITESIFGKNTIGKQALASAGASLTQRQISKIKLIGPRDGIILSPDNDKAGIQSILSNAKLLTSQASEYKLYYSLPPSLPFQKNGETRHTKDFNELVEHCGMSCAEVRTMHDQNIKRLTTSALIGLHSRLK